MFNDIKNEEFKVFKMFVKDLLKDILYCDKILFGLFVIDFCGRWYKELK